MITHQQIVRSGKLFDHFQIHETSPFHHASKELCMFFDEMEAWIAEHAKGQKEVYRSGGVFNVILGDPDEAMMFKLRFL